MQYSLAPCLTVVYVGPQAPLLVRTAASIAPMLVTGPCLSHPPVLMMASVVRWLCVWTFLLSSVQWMEWYCICNLSFSADCCDTTDEYNSGAKCENTCKWVLIQMQLLSRDKQITHDTFLCSTAYMCTRQMSLVIVLHLNIVLRCIIINKYQF